MNSTRDHATGLSSNDYFSMLPYDNKYIEYKQQQMKSIQLVEQMKRLDKPRVDSGFKGLRKYPTKLQLNDVRSSMKINTVTSATIGASNS